jgi:carboxylate-amine ligase
VCDTPLTVERAALLAAYAQTLARYLLHERPVKPCVDLYRVYGYNRFLACRFGLEGNVIDAATREHRLLKVDILDTLGRIAPHARELQTTAALAQLRDLTAVGRTDSAWLRKVHAASGSLSDMVRAQSEAWMTDSRGARRKEEQETV